MKVIQNFNPAKPKTKTICQKSSFYEEAKIN